MCSVNSAGAGFYGVGEVNGTGEILGCLSLTPLLPALGSPFEE